MRRKNSLRDRILIWVGIVCTIALAAFGTFRLVSDYLRDHADQDHYDTIANEYYHKDEADVQPPAETPSETTPEKPSAPAEQPKPEVIPVDFASLKKINPDVIGWINVPGTAITYPIMQGKDNSTYLHEDIKGNKSISGSIFLDYESQGDFSGYHNVIYGHHMRNGSMFHDIVKFQDKSFFFAHRIFTIYTPERVIHLRTMAVIHTSGTDSARRRTDFNSTQELRNYLRQMTEGCAFRCIPRGTIRTLYSLVTCSYETDNSRTVLYAAETSAWDGSETGTAAK